MRLPRILKGSQKTSDQTIESLKQEIHSYVPEDVRDDVETTNALESTLKKMDEAQLETIGQDEG